MPARCQLCPLNVLKPRACTMEARHFYGSTQLSHIAVVCDYNDKIGFRYSKPSLKLGNGRER